MKRSAAVLTGAACLALAACGGGGGGVNSMPTPTPSPTPSGNTTLTDLKYSQTFANDAARTTPTFDLAARTTLDTDAETTTLSIRYDATSKSYTVTSPTGSQTFAPADLDPSSDALQSIYVKNSGSARDYLTIAKTPYTSSTPTRYVQMAFWQHNTGTLERQDTAFDIFTFGLPTASASVPRSGQGKFDVNVFGFVTIPGVSPRTIQGAGAFNVDFQSGVFSSHTYVDEYDLISGAGTFGALELLASGHLGSGGTFSGNVAYSGGAISLVGGTIEGRFYGPGAEELGASFAADNADGAALAGAMTGVRDPSLPDVNLTLDNLQTPQLFYDTEVLLRTVEQPGTSEIGADTNLLNAQLTLSPDGSVEYGPGISNLPTATFTDADAVARTDPDFKRYEKVADGTPVAVEFYAPEPGSGTLALTYASFGRWQATTTEGTVTVDNRDYFAFGLQTPDGALLRRTGSGHYDGVAYGGATDSILDRRYDVTGTSGFDVDFDAQSYSGNLALRGTSADGATRDFGRFDFAGQMGSGNLAPGAFDQTPYGEIRPRFFGPTGEEIAGPFQLFVPQGDPLDNEGVWIAGVAAAKRR
jgi:hypothetical protein